MADQSTEVPTQRGTSSGEIGQNPVEVRGKQPVPPSKDESTGAPRAEKDKAGNDSSSTD
jgi:hypothetical protein